MKERDEAKGPAASVRVLLFAGAKDAIGSSFVDVAIGDAATAADVLAALRRDHPEVAALLESSVLALDGRTATPDAPVAATSEVALIPPVSGG